MNFKIILVLIFLSITTNMVFSQDNTINFTSLESGFQNPPNDAKARTWWHWISGNVSKSGITKDLEAMKQVGIQEAQLFNVHLGFPQGPVKYLSEDWLELFKFSAEEAERLGLELAFHNSAGWSSSGGPWVTPENAMQTVVSSEVLVKGNQQFKDQLPKPETKFDYYRDIAVLAFPKPSSDARIDGLDYKMLSERIRNHLLPDDKEISKNAIIPKASIIDLTSRLTEDGFLEWQVPDGNWVILRLGHTPIGTQNRPAPPSGKGLEVDKMSRKALDAYWQDGIQPIINKLGDLIGTTVNNCIIDSYEVETTNWTIGFDSEFEKHRGYCLLSYLPTLAGYYVESGEISERFLWDFRRTLGDLIAENYYAHFAKLCHENNLKFSVEPYWGPFDNMQVGATGDIVMCEFWSGGYPFFDSAKFVSSIAHLNGSSIVGAESFTGIGGWDEHPAQLKSIGDRAWAEGITRFIFHTYVHQPWDVAPGLALSYHGTDFNRLNTWWVQGRAFMDYIARSQFLLQQGRNIADVLVYTGASSPNTAFLKPNIKKMGFDYDLIGVNKFHDLFVQDGLICTPVGGKYSILMLPQSDWMKPETLEKINELVNAGGNVIGARPLKSPSLTNFANSDHTIKNIAEALWDSGKVIDISIEAYLRERNGPADFKLENEDKTDINFIHRKNETTDIYFIANARKESRDIIARFRVSGKQPELWNAETGEMKDLVVFNENNDGTTTVPIPLGIEEAVFVIFNKPISSKNYLVEAQIQVEKPKLEPLSNLKIIKAEYGTFLQEGLVDITEIVAEAINDGKLNFQMSRGFCDCDPAMGYKKEFRMAYKIGQTKHQIYAEEREHISIDAGNQKLQVLKAVFGKFKEETKGIPENFETYNITDKIKNLVSSGDLNIPVNSQLIGNQIAYGNKTALKITYSTDGNEHTLFVREGRTLKLSKDKAIAELVYNEEKIKWITPYPGKISFKTASGKAKSIVVKSVPKPIELSGSWEISFPPNLGAPKNVKFDNLISWSESDNLNIQHFSGTATYKKEFELPEDYLKANKSLELDLGSVAVIAELFINGKNAGILWREPFRIKIDDYVKSGKNSIEIKITNLWPNRLIGDESLPLDYERNGNKMKNLPDWLLENLERKSRRTTFPSYKHWSKDDTLLTSGLLGPVKINVSAIKSLN